MRTKRLGNTDLDLSVIGLGTWAIGGSGWDFGWGLQEEKASIATVLRAMESGINWIDTAAIYGVGRAEEVVGKALKEWKDKCIVASKCGLIGNKEGHVRPLLKRASIFEEVENSLRRLQRDVIDLYQIHWPSPDGDIVEAWKALQDLKKQGKIRWAGVSNFSISQMERITPFGKVSSLQPPYSVIKREIEEEILPWCKKNGTGVIAYSPMQCGLLTGKVDAKWISDLPDDDWRKTKSEFFKEPYLSAVINLVEDIRTVAERAGRGVAEAPISWVLRRSEITATIAGARTPWQVENLVNAADWELDENDLAQIEAAYAKYRAEVT